MQLRFRFTLRRFLYRRQQAGELLVALEQKLYALRVAAEHGFAVAGVHGVIQRLVRLHQCGRHGERVVEIGERTLRELCAGIQHGLGGFLDLAVLRVAALWPRKVVVDDARRIPVIAF